MDHQNGPGTFQDVVGEVWYATDTEIDDDDRQNHTYTKWKGKSLSRVQVFVTPWTVQSMEFSRPESWSG